MVIFSWIVLGLIAGVDAPKEVRVLRAELQPEVAGAPGQGPRATFPPKKSYDFRGT